MIGRRTKVAAVALAIGSSSLALDWTASQASANGSTVSRAASATYALAAYAGSAKYLVYGRFTVGLGRQGRLAPTGELFVRTLHGKPRNLGTVSRTLDQVSLAGPMLVRERLSETGAPSTVAWHNLATGVRGSFETRNAVIAAPTGWIITKIAAAAPHAQVVYLYHAAGGRTRLGSPHPDGSGFSLSVSASTVVASSPYDDVGNGTAEYVALSHPGTFHPLVPASDKDVTARCDSVTGKFVACGTSGSADRNALFSVTGNLIVRTRRHCPQSGVPAVDGSSMAWVVQHGSPCPSHRLVIVSPQGKTTVVPGTFGIGTPTAAFGKIVVGKHLAGGNRYFTELVVVTSTGHQRVIVG